MDDKCHWKWDDDYETYITGCGKELCYNDEIDLEYTPYCPCCGKKIVFGDCPLTLAARHSYKTPYSNKPFSVYYILLHEQSIRVQGKVPKKWHV